MTVADGRDPGDGAVETNASPWAGDVPVTVAPIEFMWAPSEQASSDAGSSEPAPSEPVLNPAEQARVGRRRPALIAVVALAGLVGIVGAFNVLRGDNNSASSASVDPSVTLVPAADPTDDPLPAAEFEPAATDPPADQTDEGEPVDAGAAVDATDGLPAGDGTGLGGEATFSPDNGVWATRQIEVPAGLAQLAPMTLVTMSSQGVFHEIDLPAGEVRSIGLGRVFGGSQVEVGATTSLIAGFESGPTNSLLIRAGQLPIGFELPRNRNDIVSIPLTDNYVTFSYDGDPNVVSELLIDGTGALTVEERSLGPVVPWQNSYSPSGRVLVTDAGGVYEQQDDGASERISNGVLISASSHHLLVRECDAVYECDFVLINGESGDRAVVQIDDILNPQLAGETIQVSPDGEFLRFLALSPSGSRQVLVNLSSGNEVQVEDTGFMVRSASVWAAGSEGVFRTSPKSSGLDFLDRATGNVIPFAAELGALGEFGVRLGLVLPDPVAPSALTTGINLIGLSVDGDVVQIDVDTGDLTSTEAPPIASSAPARVLPDVDGALIVSYDNVPSIRFDAAEGRAVFVRSSRPGGKLISGPLPGSVWESKRSVADGRTLSLVDGLGRSLDSTIFLPDRVSVIASDGRGDVLIDAELGGVFIATADAVPKLLTTGEVLAVNAAVAFVRECDEMLRCSVVRVDRSTGERAAVADAQFDWVGAMPSGIVWSGSNVSPDGAVVIAFSRDDVLSSNGAIIIDRSTGNTVGVVPIEMSSPIIWTADSRFAVFLADDMLQIYDRAAGLVRPQTSLPQLKAIAAAP